ncbi:hypothetical protein DMB92_02690 [Campylobacter sp. MIT 99-7217]|nr:hypothetical protein DMB92_02690 [Campylobacter sp. MIT 99-7217]
MKIRICLLLFLCLSVSLCDEFDDFEAEFEEFKVNDPLSGYNKMMTSFNIGFYSYVARPAIKSYNFITPQFLRTGVKNIMGNLAMPMRVSSLLLQFKFKEVGIEFKRFGVNMFFGFFGVIDAASNTGIAKYPADFGTALAHWGVGSGFHLVLPILGPSNLRDTLSMPVNWYLVPTGYIEPFYVSLAVNSYVVMNELSFQTDTLDELYYNTPNVYPFLRDAYEQRRIEMSK